MQDEIIDDLDPVKIAREYERECYNDWLDRGLAAGWISMPDCQTHNRVPVRQHEEIALSLGEQPCIHVARVWFEG